MKWTIFASVVHCTCAQARTFSCSLTWSCKTLFFYPDANSTFGKIGRIASKEVTLQLVKSKRTPGFLYGLEACPHNSFQLTSLDFDIFVINGFLWNCLIQTAWKQSKPVRISLLSSLYSIRLGKRRKKIWNKIYDQLAMWCPMLCDIAY